MSDDVDDRGGILAPPTHPIALPERPELVPGIDVSHYQGEIDWGTVAVQVGFAYLKCTEGSTEFDESFAANWAGSGAVSLPRGAYHYLAWQSPAESQAANFLRHCQHDSAALRPALDLETAAGGELPQTTIARALAWLRIVEREFGVRPIVYTYRGFAKGQLRHPSAIELGEYDLWLAHPEVAAAVTPWPWTEWAIWQRSFAGRIDGVPAPKVDLNWARALPL